MKTDGKREAPRLVEKYRHEVVPLLMKRFKYTNAMQVPRMEKIVINMGIGMGAQDIKILERAVQELALITGQRPVVTRAKQAISNFKIKEGSPIGCKVTLRKARMYEFLDRLVSVALPRIRDFRGLPRTSFDGTGNYTFGLSEQLVFPEVGYDQVQKVQGMDVTVVTSASTSDETMELLKAMGVPFRERAHEDRD